MDGQSLLIQALVYLAAGVISVPIAKRLGLGSVLGYLIAGVLIGPFVLDLVGEATDVMIFAEFGVVIMLFLIGLEVRPALLWRMRTAIFGLGLAQLLLTAAAIGAVAFALGLDPRMAVAIGLVLALSSTAIVLQSLEERGLRRGAAGEGAFGVLLLQDLAVIPMFAFLPLLASLPPGEGGGHHAVSLVGGLPAWAQALASLAAISAVVFGGRYLVRPIFRFIAEARLREIFTAFALLLVVAVAALMQMVGLSPALGAFLAGVVLAESEFRRELETDIEPFRGLLLGLFFITVGAGVNFAVILERPLLLIGLVLGLMVLKAALMFGVARAFRIGPRDSATAAVALAQGGEFAFVLLGLTVGSGVLEPEIAELLTAVVAVSMALTPVALALHERFVLAGAGRPEEEPDDNPFDDGAPDVILAGFGRFGQVVERMLTSNNFRVVTLDSSISQIDMLRRFGREVHYGDAGRLDLLRTAGVEQAKVLVVAIDDPDRAIDLVRDAREAFPHLTVVARAWDRPHAYQLLKAGAHVIERETFEAGVSLGRSVLEKLGFSERRATRAAGVFRRHDNILFKKLMPVADQEERYILAARESRETMERLLRTEMIQAGEEEDEAEAASAAPAPRERQPV